MNDKRKSHCSVCGKLMRTRAERRHHYLFCVLAQPGRKNHVWPMEGERQ